MKPYQERIILQWMKKNNARSIGYRSDSVEDLLQSLDFNSAQHSTELRRRLRNKVELKIVALCRKLEANDTITILNRNTGHEMVTFSKWTDIWLTDLWDGTLDRPDDWESQLESK